MEATESRGAPTESDGADADGAGPVVLVFDQVNAYQTRLLEGIRSVLVPAHIPLIVYAHDPFASAVRPALKRLLRSPDVRGVITTLLTDNSSQADLGKTLARSTLPMVHIGSVADSGWSVGVDNAAGMRALMAHVLDDVGAKRIAIVRGLVHHPDAREREAVVRAELAARGLELDPALVLEGRFDRDVAYKSTELMVKNAVDGLPDVIVAFNDRSAVGVLAALTDAGVRVPIDISVTGFDDDAISRESVPGVTTVSQELFAQGARAAELLLQRLAGGAPIGHVSFPGTVVVRGSTGSRTRAPQPGVSPGDLLRSQARAVAAMDRALSINRAFMACSTPHELLTEVGASLSRLGMRRCFLVLNEDADAGGSTGVLALAHADGRTQVTIEGEPFALDDALPGTLRRELSEGCLMLQPLSVDGRDLGYIFFEQVVGDRFVGELLRVDLSRAIDTMQQNRRHAQSLESLVALRTEELQAEIAIRSRAERELRRVNQELLTLSKLDGLTGLANRAAFDRYIGEQWAAHLTEGRPLSILLLDVDKFKEHNDQYGHVSGDACLRAVAQCLRESVWSPDDLAARYGGDEFVALLPHTDALGAAAVAERVQRSVRDLERKSQQRPYRPFTVSIGVSTVLPRVSLGPSDLVERADAALYKAKMAGRNCRVSAE